MLGTSEGEARLLPVPADGGDGLIVGHWFIRSMSAGFPSLHYRHLSSISIHRTRETLCPCFVPNPSRDSREYNPARVVHDVCCTRRKRVGPSECGVETSRSAVHDGISSDGRLLFSV